MTIDEAVERLTFIKKAKALTGHPRDAEAVQFGIEALKRWKQHRRQFPAWRYDFLPDEIEE